MRNTVMRLTHLYAKSSTLVPVCRRVGGILALCIVVALCVVDAHAQRRPDHVEPNRDSRGSGLGGPRARPRHRRDRRRNVPPAQPTVIPQPPCADEDRSTLEVGFSYMRNALGAQWSFIGWWSGDGNRQAIFRSVVPGLEYHVGIFGVRPRGQSAYTVVLAETQEITRESTWMRGLAMIRPNFHYLGSATFLAEEDRIYGGGASNDGCVALGLFVHLVE
jgi:hypothetical protein